MHSNKFFCLILTNHHIVNSIISRFTLLIIVVIKHSPDLAHFYIYSFSKFSILLETLKIKLYSLIPIASFSIVPKVYFVLCTVIGVPSMGAGGGRPPPPVFLKLCRRAPSVFLKFADGPLQFCFKKSIFTVRSCALCFHEYQYTKWDTSNSQLII